MKKVVLFCLIWLVGLSGSSLWSQNSFFGPLIKDSVNSANLKQYRDTIVQFSGDFSYGFLVEITIDTIKKNKELFESRIQRRKQFFMDFRLVKGKVFASPNELKDAVLLLVNRKKSSVEFNSEANWEYLYSLNQPWSFIQSIDMDKIYVSFNTNLDTLKFETKGTVAAISFIRQPYVLLSLLLLIFYAVARFLIEPHGHDKAQSSIAMIGCIFWLGMIIVTVIMACNAGKTSLGTSEIFITVLSVLAGISMIFGLFRLTPYGDDETFDDVGNFYWMVITIVASITIAMIAYFGWLVLIPIIATALIGIGVAIVASSINKLKDAIEKKKQGKQVLIKQEQEWQKKSPAEKVVLRLEEKVKELEKLKRFVMEKRDFISLAIDQNGTDADKTDMMIRKYENRYKDNPEKLKTTGEYQNLLTIKRVLASQKGKLSESQEFVLKFFNETIEQMNVQIASIKGKITEEDLNSQARELIGQVAKDLLKRQQVARQHFEEQFLGILNAIDCLGRNALEGQIITNARDRIQAEIGPDYTSVPEGLDEIAFLIEENDTRNQLTLDEYGKSIEEKISLFKEKINEIPVLLEQI